MIRLSSATALWVLCSLLAAVPADARWLEASSQHFVVYADGDEDYVRGFSRDIERFHAAVAVATRVDVTPPSPSNRVTIYVVRDEAQVRRLYGRSSASISAFYIPRAGGSLAIVPRVKPPRAGQPDWSMIAMLHEYVHHLTFQSGNRPMPSWLSEGLAEFYSSVKFEKDGSVVLGYPANHRGPELVQAPDVPVLALLDPDRASRLIRGNNNFYGKSWLLFHYLSLEPKRKGQLARYVALVTDGTPSLDAARTAFGDLRGLDSELRKYMRQKTMMTLVLPPASFAVGEVTVRVLSDGEAAMMPVRIRSKRGVSREQALELLPEARKVAAEYPEDPAVLAVLSEAEFDAGNDDAAIAAADAALARDTSQVDAYVQKGYALMRKAGAADDKAAAFRAARAPFLALNRLENDHPLPLVYNYTSIVAAGLEPSANAKRGLEKAVELAPFDPSLRLMLASQYLRDREAGDARPHIEVVAFDPHGGRLSDHLRDVLERLDAGEEVGEKDLYPSAAAGPSP